MLIRKSSRMFGLAVAGMRSGSGSNFLVAVLDKAVDRLKSLETLQEDLIGNAKFLDHRIDQLYREGFKPEELEDLTRSVADLDHTIMITRDRVRALEGILKDPYSSPPGEFVELGLIEPSEMDQLRESLTDENSFILRLVMAFSKRASAIVVDPKITLDAWSSAIRANASVRLESFGTKKASTVLGEYDPSRYMLSHATIVASVDVADSKEPLGRHMVDGVEIERKYADYLITPKTECYINDNFDGFERKLLLSTFKTFVGSESYVEHMQIPALSKGKIIDAVARDIGDSVYIDILVANDLKHRPLIEAIKSGQLNTLSMGATVAHTTCTICGNVASDETQLCTHIKSFKGSKFEMPDGTFRVAAELCGHVTDPESCRFIEASWVGNPAFKGAVLRNVLIAPSSDAATRTKIQNAFSLPQVVADPAMWQKAASLGLTRRSFPVSFQNPSVFPRTPVTDDSSTWVNDTVPRPKVAEDQNGFESVVEDYYNAVREKVRERLQKDLEQPATPEGEKKPLDQDPSGLDANDNESLIQTAFKDSKFRRLANTLISQSKNKKEDKKVLAGLVLLLQKTPIHVVAKKTGLTGTQLLRVSYILDRNYRKTVPAGLPRLYQTVLHVGGTRRFQDPVSYIQACETYLGRQTNNDERKFLISRGKILSLNLSNLLIPALKTRTDTHAYPYLLEPKRYQGPPCG